MKKFFIFLIVVLIIISSFCYIYLNFQANYNAVRKQNSVFQNYYQKNVYGPDVATAINKAIDSNTKNGVKKDDNGEFIENDSNSIKISIKMLDNDNVYSMEKIAASGIENFIEYYNRITFKCTNVEYHKNTNLVKSMIFEQISV